LFTVGKNDPGRDEGDLPNMSGCQLEAADWGCELAIEVYPDKREMGRRVDSSSGARSLDRASSAVRRFLADGFRRPARRVVTQLEKPPGTES